MDPEGTLPQVSLVLDETRLQATAGSLLPQHYNIVHEGQTVGRTTIVENTRRKREAFFNEININEELRGRGFGMATYIAAIEHAHSKGETFRTHDWTQTEAAAKVWGKFIDAGIAEIVEPITYSHTEENGTVKFTSHLRIPPQPA